MKKTLCKSRTDTKLDGICAGFANYFGISVLIVRILWIISAICFFFFPTCFIYIILVFIMPREKEVIDVEQSERLQ